MASQPDKLNPSQLEPSRYLIDPVFLTSMELLAVKLLKLKKQESHQIPNIEDLSQNSRNPKNFNANRNQTMTALTPCPQNALIHKLIDPQFFMNICRPSCPQVVKVYMLFNQNSSNQANVRLTTTYKEQESKITNKATNSKPLIFPPYPCVSSQAQKDAKDQARKTSYNPNEVGLHYLKGMNNNPQTSTIQVDGQKRIIVQIKRDSNKMSNTSQNVQNIQNQNSHGQSIHSNQSMPIHEGWNNHHQNGNNLSQGQNFFNQKNIQHSYPNNSNFTHSPKEIALKSGLVQNFSLVQQTTEASHTPQKYFSFGKNDKSNTKDYNTPFKILESLSKEESSENNEDSENKKSEVISYKRANVGDPLPYQGPLMDNFNKLVSLKQRRDLQEKGEIERRKIEKRKKQTRKLLLGQEDSDDQHNQKKVQNKSNISGPYANQVIASSGFSQNNQHTLGSRQISDGSQLNAGTYNSGENRMPEVQIYHRPIQGNIFENKVTSNLQYPNIQSNLNPFQMVPQNGIFEYQLPRQYRQQINTHHHNVIQPTIRQQNLTVPIITPTNIFEFLYFKELQRQRNDFNLTNNPKQSYPKERRSQIQKQECSQSNFDQLFKEFQQLICPSQQNQTIQSNCQNQGYVFNQFDAFSQRIEAKIFSPQNNYFVNDDRTQNNEIEHIKKWKLDCNLPLNVFIDLMFKYESKLNRDLISQVQVLIGPMYTAEKKNFGNSYRQSKTKGSGLMDHIEQISSGRLNKLVEQVHTHVNNELTEVYHSISKTSNGIKINPQTGNVQYPKKQELSSSDLALYQYVQNCMNNYNQIVNDPFFNAYHSDQLIYDSLKNLIWIKQISNNHETKSLSSQPHFHEILNNAQSKFYPKVGTDPKKMTQFINRYLDQIDYISLELDEKVNLILYDFAKMQYKPSARYYDLQSKENHTIDVYPHSFLHQNPLQQISSNKLSKTQFAYNSMVTYSGHDHQPFIEFKIGSNFPNNYLNEIREALSFTRNVEKELDFFKKETKENSKLGKEFSQSLKNTGYEGGEKSQADMVDEGQMNKINEFVSSMINVLSGIQANLETMTSQLYSNMDL